MDSTTVDLCETPAGVSPNGVYNFVDPPSLGSAVLAVGIVLCVISTVFGVGRLHINRTRLHSADYFTLMAVLTNIAYTGVILSHPNFYRHAWDIPVCWYTGEYLRFPFVQTILFSPALFFPKAAIFLLYRQLFAIDKRMRLAVNIGLLVTLLVYLSNIPLAVVYAAPRPGHSWASLLETDVTNSRHFALAGTIQSGVGTLLDFYIFFLPLPIVWHLQMTLAKRLQLAGLFSTALLGVAASVVSLIFKAKILSSNDSSWLAAITSMCSLIETNIAIIVGCMPAFAQVVTVHILGSQFFKSMHTRLLGSSGRRGKSSKTRVASNEQLPEIVTFGANQGRRKYNEPWELTDTALLRTNATVMGDEEDFGQRSKPSSSYSATAHV